MARPAPRLLAALGTDPHGPADADLLARFATITGARPIFLPTPGVVGDPTVRHGLLHDPAVIGVQKMWTELTVALVGIGSVQPSPLLQRSGNAVAPEQQAELKRLGAVGDVCLRFFDHDGVLIDSPFNHRIVGITAETLRNVPRRVGVAGGANKIEAIHAAVRGGWVNTLITDLETARQLLAK